MAKINRDGRVAETLRRILSGTGRTQQALAAQLGVSVSTLYLRCTGKRRLLAEDVIAVGVVADIAPSALIGDREEVRR